MPPLAQRTGVSRNLARPRTTDQPHARSIRGRSCGMLPNSGAWWYALSVHSPHARMMLARDVAGRARVLDVLECWGRVFAESACVFRARTCLQRVRVFAGHAFVGARVDLGVRRHRGARRMPSAGVNLGARAGFGRRRGSWARAWILGAPTLLGMWILGVISPVPTITTCGEMGTRLGGWRVGWHIAKRVVLRVPFPQGHGVDPVGSSTRENAGRAYLFAFSPSYPVPGLAQAVRNECRCGWLGLLGLKGVSAGLKTNIPLVMFDAARAWGVVMVEINYVIGGNNEQHAPLALTNLSAVACRTPSVCGLQGWGCQFILTRAAPTRRVESGQRGAWSPITEGRQWFPRAVDEGSQALTAATIKGSTSDSCCRTRGERSIEEVKGLQASHSFAYHYPLKLPEACPGASEAEVAEVAEPEVAETAKPEERAAREQSVQQEQQLTRKRCAKREQECTKREERLV
ncbi:hypothetical protein FIBSPDRAFT_900197 [Athelia psychrophila]|uniref:Uncharacterized protein n=1 Tax=Athelia psychrophila TaxID=1759441 RepID=A0A165YSH0_9AGAM|nr:hypothetical protein FIBSPDRAFT_900197 [Fibularhizoctonia sp. CBS 109695]